MPPNNERYQDDIMYITKITRNILRIFGVWPFMYGKRSIVGKILKLLQIVISWILLYCVLIPGVAFWLIEKKTRVRILLFPPILHGFMAVGKYSNLIFREGQIKNCLKHIEEDWKNVIGVDARKAMLESAKTGRRLAVLCGVFMYGSGLCCRTILPLSKGKMVTAKNITVKPLPSQGYYFSFDVEISPTYEMIFAMQFFSGLVTYSITVGVCSLTALFVMHACGQLKVLIKLMNYLVEEKWIGKRDVDKRLAEVVEYQIRIRNFLRLVEGTMQQICLIEVIGCTLIVCILGYCLITEYENSNLIATSAHLITLTSMMINVFIFCYTGEQLITQAEKVALTSCELEWYRLPDKQARSVVLVMILSNLPTKITAGKILDLSLKTFGDVV